MNAKIQPHCAVRVNVYQLFLVTGDNSCFGHHAESDTIFAILKTRDSNNIKYDVFSLP